MTIAAFGVVVGAVLGAGFGVAMMRALRAQGFTESVIPVTLFAAMVLAAGVLGVLAASGATRRVARLDVLRAIAVE